MRDFTITLSIILQFITENMIANVCVPTFKFRTYSRYDNFSYLSLLYWPIQTIYLLRFKTERKFRYRNSVTSWHVIHKLTVCFMLHRKHPVSYLNSTSNSIWFVFELNEDTPHIKWRRCFVRKFRYHVLKINYLSYKIQPLMVSFHIWLSKISADKRTWVRSSLVGLLSES